jgi:hypothetical protein
MTRLAVDLLSGPAGLAALLRQSLLGAPWNTPSLPLDIGARGLMIGGQRIQVGLLHAGKTAGVMVESDTYQITVEPRL